MTVSIDGLFALVGKDMDGNPTVYSKIFTDKESAECVAKEFGMVVKPVFVSNK